ncbi:MAG: glycosyltransferase [Azoarcus sp.]|jgi:GT2 family glycosyltransferase/glycosyltransferase involved in cell wall biosynthesis|nr:glycosyltransferase [Azoarcus sp.]
MSADVGSCAGDCVDIIVPVYNGLAQVRRCLLAVAAAPCRTAREIVVIDDGSDDAALVAWLDGEAAAGRITLLRNERNLGFVATVNRGMALHPDRDVVLLNSDAEVANDWLDRLLACAGSAADIGTVTPFSNNATICSYPFEGWPGEVPGALGLTGLDALFAVTNADEARDLPTAVGFCMLIRRACLDAVGLFDADRFGRGYGEENDFCRRALALGWRSVLAADVFVYHEGGASFGAEKLAAMQRAGEVMAAIHPDYDDVVGAFVRADPLAALRLRVDQARAALGGAEFAAVMDEQRLARTMGRAQPPRPVTLHIVHGWGGGTERWVKDYASADLSCRNLVLHGVTTRRHTNAELALADPLSGLTLMRWPLANPIDGTAIEHPEYAEIIDWVCAMFQVRVLLVSSLIGHALDLFALALPTVLVTHDFYPFCPALFATFDAPCARCGDAELASCLAGNPHNAFWHVGSVAHWQTLRAAFAARLAVPHVHLVCPSTNVHERWAALLPDLAAKPWHCIGHGLGGIFTRGNAPLAAERATATPRRLRILIPGRLAPHKGLWLLRQICDEMRAFADVLLLGCGDFGMAFDRLEEFEVVKDYALDALPAEIERWQPDCALLLSILPESFGYTLSEMMALHIPVVATRLGAYTERIEDGVDGFLVEPEAAAILAKLRALEQARTQLADIAARLGEKAVRTAFDMVVDYRRLLPSCHAEEKSGESQQDPRGVANLLETLANGALAARKAAHVDVQMAKASARLAQCEAERQRLTEEVACLAARHEAILRSTSWRVSAPLRMLRRLSRRLQRGPRDDEAAQASEPGVETDVEAGLEPALETRPVSPPMPSRSRAAMRHWLHVETGKVDEAIIIAGGGVAATNADLHVFSLIADATVRRSNRAVFVWCSRNHGTLHPDDMLVLRMLWGMCRMFWPDASQAEQVFGGADVLLLPLAARERDGADAPVVDLPQTGEGDALDATVIRLLQYCAH